MPLELVHRYIGLGSFFLLILGIQKVGFPGNMKGQTNVGTEVGISVCFCNTNIRIDPEPKIPSSFIFFIFFIFSSVCLFIYFLSMILAIIY